LPPDVVMKTVDKYLACYELLTKEHNQFIAAIRKEYGREQE
jgi:hypothetical protein